ncbi:DUF3426 domain-containing protein [Undibacterium sp.]|uniref:DUF3426 domain-containing protein n=1 Tax=Undibacterium sp. TaxID=1914977 RepID=UPI0037501EC3
MALATQCPHCYTSFRVANDQLKLHAGMVRCGSCQQTFNGIEHLLAPGQAPRTPPAVLASEIESNANDLVGDDSIDNPTKESIVHPHLEFETTATENLHTADQQTVTPTPVQTVDEDALDLDADINNQTSIDTTAEAAKTRDSNVDFPSLEGEPSDYAKLEFEEALESNKVQDEPDVTEKDSTPEEFSALLETIQNEPNNASPDKGKDDIRLSSKIEFELTKEERDLIEQADHLHQLELENRVAILDENDEVWSKKEASLDQEMTQEPLASVNSMASVKTTDVKTELANNARNTTRHQELLESTKDIEQESRENDSSDSDITPGFVLLAEKKLRYGKWQTLGLSATCLLLLVGIAAQSTYFFRTSIVAHFPATKPYLLQVCQQFNCQIKLPAERRMLEISGSELLILHDELRINTLSFQIQNKSNTAQEWPVAELILKDSRGKIVLHKFFQPSAYLNNKADLAKGIAARTESEHKIHFELNVAKASNYAMGIFYP